MSFSHLEQPNCTLLPHFPCFSPGLIGKYTFFFTFPFSYFSPESFKDFNLQSIQQQSGDFAGRVKSIQQTVPQECMGSIHNYCFCPKFLSKWCIYMLSHSWSIHTKSQSSPRLNPTRCNKIQLEHLICLNHYK